MGTLSETKSFLMLPEEEWRKQLQFRLIARTFQNLEPSHQRLTPLLGQEGRRRKSISFRFLKNRPYKYRPLPNPRSIRLLQVLGFDEERGIFLTMLKTRDVDSADYDALSYT